MFLQDPQDSTSEEQEQMVMDGERVKMGRGSPDKSRGSQVIKVQ